MWLGLDNLSLLGFNYFIDDAYRFPIFLECVSISYGEYREILGYFSFNTVTSNESVALYYDEINQLCNYNGLLCSKILSGWISDEADSINLHFNWCSYR